MAAVFVVFAIFIVNAQEATAVDWCYQYVISNQYDNAIDGDEELQ